MSKSLITTTQAGQLLGKSTRTVSRLAETGQLAYVQRLPGPRGHYLFDPEVVLKFQAEQESEERDKTIARSRKAS